MKAIRSWKALPQNFLSSNSLISFGCHLKFSCSMLNFANDLLGKIHV